MNQLALVRKKIIKDQRLHDAQLIAEIHGHKTCFYNPSNFDDRRKEAQDEISQNN